MHQDLAFEEPLKFVLLILICLRFMPIKKYQDCKAILGLIQFPQGEKKLSGVRAPGKERPLQKRANHDSAGAVPHSISCKLQVVSTATKQEAPESMGVLCIFVCPSRETHT